MHTMNTGTGVSFIENINSSMRSCVSSVTDWATLAPKFLAVWIVMDIKYVISEYSRSENSSPAVAPEQSTERWTKRYWKSEQNVIMIKNREKSMVKVK